MARSFICVRTARTAVLFMSKWTDEYTRSPYWHIKVCCPIRKTNILVDEYTRPPYWDIKVCCPVRKTNILVNEYTRPPYWDMKVCCPVRKTNILVDEYTRLPYSTLESCLSLGTEPKSNQNSKNSSVKDMTVLPVNVLISDEHNFDT